jgi:hypothetical protein
MLTDILGRRQAQGKPPQLKPAAAVRRWSTPRWSPLTPQPEVVEQSRAAANPVFDFSNDRFGSCGFGHAMWGICFSKCSNSAERVDVVAAALFLVPDDPHVGFDDLLSDMINFS